MMRRIFIYSAVLLALWVILAQCFILKNRLSDARTKAIFSQKQIPLQIHDTVINDRHLHYAVSGPDSLPTLVFIHGSPGSWMNYMKYMWDTALRKRFRFVGIDRPGFGYSDFGAAMHLQDQCAVILPVLRSLKTDQPMYLCGHSMGGPVVIQLAASAPELFDKIVIVAGAIDVEQEPKDTWRKVMAVKPLFWCLPGAYAPSNTELLYLKKDLIPLQKEFSKITADVYFLHGTADTWVPIENVAFGEQMLIHARSIHSDTIVGADHQIPWKNRDILTKLLLSL